MADINVGMLSEALNEKLDRNGINAGNPCAVVVEISSKDILPSWYRVYSDGWCEQGGFTGTKSESNIIFTKPYKDTLYTVHITMNKTGGYVADGTSASYNTLRSLGIWNKTINGFTTGNNNSISDGLAWLASGYIR